MQNSDWVNYFSALSQVSATLLAILFAAYQISKTKWHEEPYKLFVIQTLIEFAIPLLFSVTFLIPSNFFRSSIIGIWQITSILEGISGIFIVSRIYYWRLQQKKVTEKFLKNQTALQFIALLVYFSLIILPIFGLFQWIAIVLIWLLISGVSETWMIFSSLVKSQDEEIVLH